jgi:predicted transcriptional regulator
MQIPIHKWPEIPDHPNTHEHATAIGHIMSTRVFTVQKDDLAELATHLMMWKNIHHVPVESADGKLCGLLTWTHMKKFFEEEDKPSHNLKTVEDIMVEKVITAGPEMSIQSAISLMKKNEIGCLPIVDSEAVIGIVTIKDIQQYDRD